MKVHPLDRKIAAFLTEYGDLCRKHGMIIGRKKTEGYEHFLVVLVSHDLSIVDKMLNEAKIAAPIRITWSGTDDNGNDIN